MPFNGVNFDFGFYLLTDKTTLKELEAKRPEGICQAVALPLKPYMGLATCFMIWIKNSAATLKGSQKMLCGTHTHTVNIQGLIFSESWQK